MKVSEIEITYSNKNSNRVKISKSIDAYEIAIQHWSSNTIELQEEAKIILLNRANIVIGIYHLSKGGISGCIVDIKLILSIALKTITSGIILIHNHPSGEIMPSTQDFSITEKLKLGCKAVDLILLDHLIITPTRYYSMADKGDL